MRSRWRSATRGSRWKAGAGPASTSPSACSTSRSPGLALLLLLPIAILIALVVLATSGRPLFYGGERVGRYGHVFRMRKFRTLRPDAESRLGPYYGAELDARTPGEVTRVGRWLRASQLDEVPQLWNVLRGDMSSSARARSGRASSRSSARRSRCTGSGSSCDRG